MLAQSQTWFWIAQRASAVVLVVCVIVHLITIIIAVQGGLTAAEILSRTRDNIPMLIFYCVFVVAAAVHAALGLRMIGFEWLGASMRSANGRRLLELLLLLYALLVLGFGFLAAHSLFR